MVVAVRAQRLRQRRAHFVSSRRCKRISKASCCLGAELACPRSRHHTTDADARRKWWRRLHRVVQGVATVAPAVTAHDLDAFRARIRLQAAIQGGACADLEHIRMLRAELKLAIGTHLCNSLRFSKGEAGIEKPVGTHVRLNVCLQRSVRVTRSALLSIVVHKQCNCVRLREVRKTANTHPRRTPCHTCNESHQPHPSSGEHE